MSGRPTLPHNRLKVRYARQFSHLRLLAGVQEYGLMFFVVGVRVVNLVDFLGEEARSIEGYANLSSFQDASQLFFNVHLRITYQAPERRG